MDWQQLETTTSSSQESGEGSGTPTIWSKFGTKIRLYPNPDAVYTLGTYVLLKAAEMSGDTDTPLIPLEFRHSVIVPYAAAILLEQEGGNEAGNAYDRLMARHREALRDMRVACATSKRPTFNVVGASAFDHLPGSVSDWQPF